MTKTPIFIIDAFADKPFHGNPAGVCPLDHWLPDETMQAIASEVNLSETVFFVRCSGQGADKGVQCYGIRWFMPTREVDMIGHATLAAGHLVLSRLAPLAQEVRFVSASATMVVRRNGTMLTLDMPPLVPTLIQTPDGLAKALGGVPTQVPASKHYLALFETADEIADLRPDFEALAQLPLPAVIVSARGTSEFDFVSRFFAPANGVPEDAVSGVAHCCLAPFWSQALDKRALIGQQLSARGGVIHCSYDNARVVLGGNAVISLEGAISI
ncbi:PhzF family phenazine biosynthesis protein [Halocynthiibacter styelae]|uniref:PhzF family phenazine biosynthesis protein n=1 Tax=Halocynthiibacter styelae TaxID=2761955 RepID=A0A8J7LKS4_9RHOB|nr:PhzF family phenazine biosynthesis protein [Paenihalocynthiibacter styelae]MBI1493209.1 PhzF family phenazine biosynthesis protein [Paenihalocynthiibacter styelae]